MSNARIKSVTKSITN